MQYQLMSDSQRQVVNQLKLMEYMENTPTGTNVFKTLKKSHS